jgi:hypothetical protein
VKYQKEGEEEQEEVEGDWPLFLLSPHCPPRQQRTTVNKGRQQPENAIHHLQSTTQYNTLLHSLQM